jgi:hypothetical protein
MNKLILAVLGTLYKMPESEVAELLKKSDGTEGFDEDKTLKLILDKDKERVTSLKAEGSTKWDDAIKKATKEVWGKVEKELKTTFDIESDLQGEELLSHVAETLPEKYKGIGKKPAELTEDEIKKHPAYIKAEKEFKKQLSDKEKELTDKLNAKETEYSQQQIFAKAKETALTKFKKLGEAILPGDAEKAEKMIQKLLIDELAGYTYQIDDKGNFIILNKDGKRAEDAHGHALEFDKLVETISKSNFEFKASKERQAPANGGHQQQQPGGGNPAPKYTGKAPSNQQEYLGLLTGSDLSTEEKLDVKAQYGEQFSN